MKMEADDAFQIRGSVQTVLGLLALLVTLAAWRATWWVWVAITARLG